jgi:hypothetical protein
MTEPKEFKGKCPLCGGKLVVRVLDLKPEERVLDIIITDQTLSCQNGDYHCKTSAFEAAWSKHAGALNTALAILLTELKDANLK